MCTRVLLEKISYCMLEVMTGVYQLPNSFVNLYLILQPDGLTLIDAGLAKSGPKVALEAIAKLGRTPKDLRRILFTHSDPDHTGGAAELKRISGSSLQTSAHEAGMMAQGKPGRPVKNPVIRLMLGLMVPRIPAQAADMLLEDGQEIPVLGGLRVINTPGHTPGHVSFYSSSQKILFAGDSMRSEKDTLSFGPGPFTWDLEAGIASVRKQAKLEVDLVCCGHGPVVRGPGIVYPYT
jgi:glyoxylase-like metal-dependent hydrolase (beta-lactamase superfamily II)